MSDKDVCAVVVTYNRRELVKKCITNILAQKDASCDVIIIDNGSIDGTEDMFVNEFSDANLHYYNMGNNLGCAAGTSIGVKKAVQAGYKYIWVMDDDVFPREDTLFELLRADHELDGNWGILSSAAYWTDGSLCKANRQKKTIFSFVSDSDYRRRFVRVSMVSLASMFIKADAVRKVGLPISDYFIYTEDYEFCSRVGKEYPIYLVPSSAVTHAMKDNSKVNFVKEKEERLYRYKYLYRNDVHCYKKLGIKGNIYLVIKLLYTATQIILFEKRDRHGKMRILINGYREGMTFDPKIEMV